MFILINPKAAGGSALRKWTRIKQFIHSTHTPIYDYVIDGEISTTDSIMNSLTSGETDFVAAGGDGTVNALLNALLTIATPKQVQTIRLGAIGLGSSNDFHKPLLPERMVRGIPVKIDFTDVSARDVGRLTYGQNGHLMTKYFLVNASVGVTAEANHFFNYPDRVLSILKRMHTPTAILYAAVKTILSFNNIRVTIQGIESSDITTAISNLGVVESPYFGGNLRYGAPARFDDGQLTVHLNHNMTRLELMNLLVQLRRGKFTSVEKSKSWVTPSVTVTAPKPFSVEFDGEVITTTSAEFSVLPKHIKVCS